MHLDPFRAGMLGDVRERFLRYPVHREPGLGREFVCLAGHRELARDATDLLELRGEAGQAFGPGQFVVAQHPDRPAGFFEPGLAQVVGTLDDFRQPGIAGVIGREHPGAFQLEHEPGQGMGEYVVHLPGEPLAFGQSSRPCLRRPGALQFDQQPFGLVVGLPEPSCQQGHAREADNRDGAEQRQGRRAVADGHRDRRQARDADDRQRDREAVWHPRGEQHEARQEPGQARPVGLQPTSAAELASSMTAKTMRTAARR